MELYLPVEMSHLCDCFGRRGRYSSTSKLPQKTPNDEKEKETPAEKAEAEDIWDLCSQGDYVGVKKALEEGKPPNWTQVYSFGESKVSNRTCLMEAVRGEHVDVVELLVRQPKIKLNTQDELGMTALHYACLQSNMQIVKILLRHPKLNPNIREHGDLSPLELSVANGHHNVVHILLDSSHVRLDTNTATGLSLEELAG